MTATQIETAARRRLNAESSTFWSQAEIIEDCLYFAMHDMAQRVRCIEATHSTTSTANTSALTKPAGVIEIKQITYEGRKLELIPEKYYFSLQLNATGIAPVGTPTHYYVWDGTYNLYPTPSVSAVAIVLRTIDEPAALSSPYSTALDIPTWMHPRLVNGTALYMLLKETDDPRTNLYVNRWEQDLQIAAGEWKRMKNSDKLPRVRLEEEAPTSSIGVV